MRVVRGVIVGAFLILCAVFIIGFVYAGRDKENTYPEIQVGSGPLKVSVSATQEELLYDVMATDKQDGNLTNSVIIESISSFVNPKKHICNITYAVEDSDKNVSKKTRELKFTDYESPKFTLSQPLCFNVGSDMSVSDVIGAVDCREGDISSKVKILKNTVSLSTAGEYSVTAQVTNSLGDTSKIKATVVVRNQNQLSPIINLKENIVYLKKGDSFDPLKYVDSVEDRSGESISKDNIHVSSSSVDNEKEGCYTVEYDITSDEYENSSTYLLVVVE